MAIAPDEPRALVVALVVAAAVEVPVVVVATALEVDVEVVDAAAEEMLVAVAVEEATVVALDGWIP